MLWRFLKGSLWRRLINTSLRLLTQVSNERLNDFSVVRHQDVPVVRVHDAPLVRLNNVFCNSQRKQQITSPWYVSTTFRSCFCFVSRCLVSTTVSTTFLNYFLKLFVQITSGRFSRLIWISNQTLNCSSINQEGNQRSSLGCKLVELLLHLKTASYTNNICNIFCVDI